MFNLIKNRKRLYYLGIFAICFFLLTFDLAFAQDAGNTGIKKEGITGLMYDLFITIGGGFLSLTGQFLDITIDTLVVNMGEFLNEGTIVAINTLWVIIRDLFNILFIFGLIYIGFKTILGVDETGTRRWLISLIGAALLINFSLYFTQVVIEFSNVAARQIHNLIVVTDENNKTLGISRAFMELTQIETYASVDKNVVLIDAVNESTNGSESLRLVMFGLLMMLFMLITSFVFAAGAFMLLARFVILIFCMIFSPAMFLGWIYPGLSKYTNMWVNTLLKNAFLAPAFLFMMYLSLMVTRELAGKGAFSAAFSANSVADGSFSIFLQFFVIIAFMIGSLMVAKTMGAFGADQSIKIGNSIRRQALGYAGRAAGGATFGLVARGLQSSAGRVGQAAAESGRLRGAAASKGVGGWIARKTINASRAAGDSSFDARRIGRVGGKIGIGEGGEGGYKSRKDRAQKKDDEFAASLGTVSSDDAQVVDLQTEVDATEQAIKKKKELIRSKQRDKRNAEDDAERNAIQANIDNVKSEIEEHEETLKKQNATLQREIHRYQVGSESRIDAVLTAEIKRRKNNIKRLLTSFDNARTAGNVAIQNRLKAEIAAEKKRLAGFQKGENEQAGGYATTVETANKVTNFFRGRSKAMNAEIGKNIRKEYMSKIKGEKS